MLSSGGVGGNVGSQTKKAKQMWFLIRFFFFFENFLVDFYNGDMLIFYNDYKLTYIYEVWSKNNRFFQISWVKYVRIFHFFCYVGTHIC